MHSSRMRTVRWGGVVCPEGGLPREGVSSQRRAVCLGGGGVCLGGGGVCPGVVCGGGGGVHLPPCGQTDTCENITFPQPLLRTVNMLHIHFQVRSLWTDMYE